VPDTVIDPKGYFSPVFMDLMRAWGCGSRNEYIGLGDVCRFFGLGDKPAGVNGGDFAALWGSGNSESRATAIAYLTNDLDMTWRLAERMGVLS
jgi:hypothetical protein